MNWYVSRAFVFKYLRWTNSGNDGNSGAAGMETIGVGSWTAGIASAWTIAIKSMRNKFAVSKWFVLIRNSDYCIQKRVMNLRGP